ncbi:HesA/MoeB/ThiF family protein [Paraburkholderia aspalathi]|nr:HesA/MoeB/ThiF family protein [Paraburkholderia aspalathi]
MSRYARQEMVPQLGVEGQEKLRKAHVLIVGAGGLGCPALHYLVGAGIGRITLVDPDHVERSNLHRQPLYGESDIGRAKVEAARDRLAGLNAEVAVNPVVAMLTPANANQLIAEADIVLDCADSFAVTYILSDTCKILGKPLISASALEMSGYVGGYCGAGPSVRALFPDLPKNLATCATAGVLGPLVGTLGTLQAQMAIAALAGIAPSPLGQMVTVDLEHYAFRSFRFDKAPEPAEIPFPFIALADLAPDDVLVELRGMDETPYALRADAIRLSVDVFQAGPVTLPNTSRVVICCRSGLRAWRAATALRPHFAGQIALIAAGDSQVDCNPKPD